MTFSKHIFLILSLAVCLAVSGCLACCSSTPTPPTGGNGHASTYSNYYSNDAGASADDIRQSATTMTAAAAALNKGDKVGFTTCLSKEAQERYGSNFDVSSAGAKTLAGIMANATVFRSYSDEIIYQYSYDGDTYYFSTMKEDGVWKIDSI